MKPPAASLLTPALSAGGERETYEHNFAILLQPRHNLTI
jgi:hypothetical protein